MLVILSYFFSSYLPVTWGWENGPLEWAQVIILTFGAVLSGYWWQEMKSNKLYRPAGFFFWSLPIWLLMISRELSWGRVFYPAGIDPLSGPYFISVSRLPYGKFIYPVITLILFVWLYAVIKYKLYAIPYELFQQERFATGEFIIVIVSFGVAGIAEKYLQNAILEESVECIAYLALILTAYRIKVALLQRNTIILPHRLV